MLMIVKTQTMIRRRLVARSVVSSRHSTRLVDVCVALELSCGDSKARDGPEMCRMTEIGPELTERGL